MTTEYVLADARPEAPPWAAERFQVQRNGTRYYADQMAPCDLIADPHAEPVPGFSSLKPSKPFRKSVTVGDRKYTVPLDWYRAGEWWLGGLNTYDAEDLAQNDTKMWHAFYQSVNVQRDRDFARGHAIHQAAEDVLNGKMITNTNQDAAPYIPHLAEWLERNVTDVNAIEAVVFGDGYGGTGDAWLNVRGVPAYVDWKSRGADSSHGIYEEEVAQGGGYTSARYCILPSDDRQTAVRAPLPGATFGLVLSIRPDGVEEFWYDLAVARDAFAEMFGAYRQTSEFGKVARRAKLKGDPTTTAATSKRMPKSTVQPTPARVAPDEGGAVDVSTIRDRYVALDAAARSWVEAKRAEALAAGVDFHLKDNYTARRASIMDGLVTLAEAEADDDDAVKALMRFATTDDACEWPTVEAGAAIGSMGYAEAEVFAATCRLFVGGTIALELTLTGPRLAEVVS